MHAFFDLDSERATGFGIGRIGWLSIREYSKAFDLDEVQTDDLFFFIKEMDSVYLKWAKEKMDHDK